MDAEGEWERTKYFFGDGERREWEVEACLWWEVECEGGPPNQEDMVLWE